MAATTTKYALPIPQGIDPPDIQQVADLGTAIDGKMTGYLQGTLAAIPAPSKEGLIYRCTDAANLNRIFMDSGTAWLELTKESNGAVEIFSAQLPHAIAVGANNQVTMVTATVAVSQPGVIQMKARHLFVEYGATGATNTAFDIQFFLDGAWYGSDEGSLTAPVSGAFDYFFMEKSKQFTVTKANHNVGCRLAVFNVPVLMGTSGQGRFEIIKF